MKLSRNILRERHYYFVFVCVNVCVCVFFHNNLAGNNKLTNVKNSDFNFELVSEILPVFYQAADHLSPSSRTGSPPPTGRIRPGTCKHLEICPNIPSLTAESLERCPDDDKRQTYLDNCYGIFFYGTTFARFWDLRESQRITKQETVS